MAILKPKQFGSDMIIIPPNRKPFLGKDGGDINASIVGEGVQIAPEDMAQSIRQHGAIYQTIHQRSSFDPFGRCHPAKSVNIMSKLVKVKVKDGI